VILKARPPRGQALDVTTRRARTAALIPVERIERRILRLRSHNVLLDADLAALYGVATKRFNEQVRRNVQRFPPDFMFRLTPEEFANLRSRIATSSARGHGGRRHAPYVFTEHGAIMAANILNSPRAIRTSIVVVRAFVRLREMLHSNADLARKLDALEMKYDAQFKVVFQAIRELMAPPAVSKKRIGFRLEGHSS
jgi:ORF6N domain-containing protein